MSKLISILENLNPSNPSSIRPHIEALQKSDLFDELTSLQLAEIVTLMQKAYQNGKSDAGAEKIDLDCVWINGVGGIEKQEDGSWLLVYKDKPLVAASILGHLGGSSTSEAKKKSSRENGKKGGRPKKAI